jgi:hypothetical protein
MTANRLLAGSLAGLVRRKAKEPVPSPLFGLAKPIPRTNTSATIVVVDVLFTNKGEHRPSSAFHSGTRATTTLAGVSLIRAGDGPPRLSSRPGWVQQDVVPAGHDDVGDFNCFRK